MAFFAAVTTRNRLIFAIVGAVSGLLAGLGGVIVLVQGGAMDPDVGRPTGWPLFGMVAGALVGLVNPSKWFARALWVGLVVVFAVVALVANQPASAQGMCSAEVLIDGESTRLQDTTKGRPLRIDVGREPRIEVVARAPGVERGVVEVAVRSVSPGLLVDLDDSVLYYDVLVEGVATADLHVEASGPTGFKLITPEFESALVPLGVVGIEIVVVDLSTASPEIVCDDVAWIQIVARPSSNPIGRAALLFSAVGLAGLTAVGPLREILGIGPSPLVPVAGDVAEWRVCRPDGLVVRPRLSKRRKYVLKIELNPGLKAGEDDESQIEGESELEVRAFARTRKIRVRPALALGLGSFRPTHDFEILGRRRGRHEIVVEVEQDGDVVQRDVVVVTVVDDAVEDEEGAVHPGPWPPPSVIS